MNHVYKVVFNRALGVYQCVSEIAKSQGKSSGKSATSHSTNKISSTFKLTALSVGLGLLGASGSAMAEVYNNGQTTTIPNDIYFAYNDIIANTNTLLAVNNFFVSSDSSGIPTKTVIENQGSVDTTEMSAIVEGSTLEIKNEGNLKSDQVYVGVNDGDGNLVLSGNSNIEANNLWLGGQDPNEPGGNIGTVDVNSSSLDIAEEILVGGETNANLNITNNSQVKANHLYMGFRNTSDGNVRIDNSEVQLPSDMIAGVSGTGDLTLTNNASVISGQLFAGYNDGSKGTITIDGSSYTTINTGIGKDGDGELNIINYGQLENNEQLSLSQNVNSQGKVNVKGYGSRLTTDDFNIGLTGKGFVTLSDEANVKTNRTFIANNPDSEGKIDIDNAQYDTSDMVIGLKGKGQVNISNSGALSVENIFNIGQDAGSKGIATVKGLGSTLNAASVLTIGNSGEGSLNVVEGGKAEVGNLLMSSEDTTSQATISGESSQLIVTDNIVVGKGGSATLSFFDNAYGQADVLSIANTANADNSVVNTSNSVLNLNSNLFVGDAAKGTLNINNNATVNTSSSTENIIIGRQTGSNGIVNIYDTNSKLITAANMAVGSLGTGTLNVNNGASVKIAKDIVVGDGSSGIGTINYDGDSKTDVNAIQASNLIVGSYGNGTVNIKNTYDPVDTSYDYGLYIVKDTNIGNFNNSIGELNIESTLADLGNVIVGNKGSGALNVTKKGNIGVSNISRGMNSENSSIYFDNAYLTVYNDQPNLFNNFTNKQTINISNDGLIIDVEDHNVKIDPQAIITGNVGAFNLDEVKGGFFKVGTGTLELSSNTKKWTGETGIANGTLKINGDFSLNPDDILSIGIGLDDEDVVDIDQYGKLLVDGHVKIDNAKLKVYVTEAMAEMDSNLIWKDVVKATTRSGEFQKDIIDNNLLVEFKPDYSDPNAVHLRMISQAEADAKAEAEAKAKAEAEAKAKAEAEAKAKAEAEAKAKAEAEAKAKAEAEAKAKAEAEAKAKAEAEAKAKAEAEAKAKAEAEAKAKAEAEAKAKAEAEKLEAEKEKAEKEKAEKEKAEKEKAEKEKAEKEKAEKEKAEKEKAEKLSNAFFKAVNSVNNSSVTSLATVLDQTVDDQLDKTTPKNALGLQLITEAEGLDQQQLAAVAQQLQPLFMGGANRLITDSNYATTNAISEHSQTTLERNLWAKAIGSDMTHDADGYVTGYNSENYGAVVGLDMPINPDLNLGVAVSYIESDTDTDGHALNHELEAKNWQVLGYGNYAASEATSINFHAGAGQSSVDGERHIQLPSSLTAKSDYDVDTMQAGFGVSHQLGTNTRNVAPFASFNYARAESDGYSETGAGAYNLTVDENTYESMRWTAGLRFNQALTPTVSVTGQLAGAIENGDSYSDITASFTEVGSNKFYTQGQESKEAIGIAGIGLAFKPTANTTISANYNGEWRDNYDDQGAAIVFETKF